MKNKILAAGILILPVALFLYFWWTPGAVHDQETQSATNSSGSPVPAVTARPDAPIPPPDAGLAAAAPAANPPTVGSAPASAAMPIVTKSRPQEPEFTDIPPEIVLEKVAHAIRDYASMFGDNPVGTNPEITAALNGNNPRQAHFINPEAGMRINGNGELVDAWGTPYFFHQLSGTRMEIHSAGPDRVMWTADDLVSK
jgi:hypothetical protein